MSSRRFPPPWPVEETDACFIIRDANGQALWHRPGPNIGLSIKWTRVWQRN